MWNWLIPGIWGESNEVSLSKSGKLFLILVMEQLVDLSPTVIWFLDLLPTRAAALGNLADKNEDIGVFWLLASFSKVLLKKVCLAWNWKEREGVPIWGTVETNWTRNHEVVGLIPGLTHWVKDPALPLSCGVGCRYGSDPALLWLWCSPAAAALIRSPSLGTSTCHRWGTKKAKKNKNKKKFIRSSCCGSSETIWLASMRMQV